MNLEERRTLATASDINLIRGQIEDAVALMIEELANINPESTYEDWEDAVAQMKSKTKTEDLLELIKPFMMLRIPTNEG